MKRIDVSYGGETYSVGHRDLDDLKQEIAQGLASGSHWLVVNADEGSSHSAHLLITPSTLIALTPIPGDAEANG